MDAPDFLAHLRRELTAFAVCLNGDLSAPVEHCGDWTLLDLAEHLGRSNLWAARAVTEQHGDYEAPPAPRDRAELTGWFDAASRTLLDALDRDPSVPAWTFRPPRTVGFWQRRRPHETLIHRWDAEHALGLAPALDTDLAADGVAEVFDTIAPRQIERGRATPPRYAIRVIATDTATDFTYGPGQPVATISGTAVDLLLLLWGRRAPDDEAIEWRGDRTAALSVLDGPLVA
jgi:uncharacterized protein (TIGR03083 family)